MRYRCLLVFLRYMYHDARFSECKVWLFELTIAQSFVKENSKFAKF